MESSIHRIEQLVSTLKELQPLKPEYQQRLDKKIRLEFNYNSNHIEGNTLTYGETELLLIFDKTTGNHELREYEEMKAHDVAFELIKEWAQDKERSLNEIDIKNLHEILLVRPFWKEAITPDGQPTRRLIKIAQYKEFPNSVRLKNGEIFHYATPEETPALMGDLIKWYRNEETSGEIHPATLAAFLHYKFVCIHPFDDGNGRISRLLLNYALLKNDLPPVIIKTTDKKNYLFALNQADAGNENAFIEYVLDQLINSLEMNIRAAKGENLEEDGDLLKEISILSKQVSNGDSVTKHPKIIYDIFNWFQKTIWNAIHDSLTQFEKLFSERKQTRSLNLAGELYEKSNIFLPYDRLTDPGKLKILGHDIYEKEINVISFVETLYGIKGAKGKPEIPIKADLFFRTKEYTLKISMEREILLEQEYKYGEVINESDIKVFQNMLSKRLLEEIKERIK